jgi:Golgi complex component 7 (COG7).
MLVYSPFNVPDSRQQLIILIHIVFTDYLNNVLEELGVDLTETLQQILTLLRLEPAEYHQQSIGCSHKLVASIREMRSLV